jgi:hypothetical protein
LGLPLITTRFPFHAPEIEYLNDGCLITADPTGSSLASAALNWIEDPRALASARQAAYDIGDSLSIEGMAHNFNLAIRRALKRP